MLESNHTKNTLKMNYCMSKIKSWSNGGVKKIKSTNEIIFDTSKPYFYKWLSIVNLVVLYNIIFVIGRSVFWELENLIPIGWRILDHTSDIIYMIDIFVRMHEGYLEQGLLVRDSTKLRKRYLKSKYFILDILSIFPMDIYYIFLSDTCFETVPCPVIARLNRVLRLDRTVEFFEKTETRTNFPNAFRITKVVLSILVLIHWNACIFFAISFAIGFGVDGWVYQGSPNLATQYIYSFYWSTLTLTTIGETPQPAADIEYLFVTVDFLIGVLIFATIVVGKDLENRVIKWFDYLWSNKQSMDEESVLSMLPDKLKSRNCNSCSFGYTQKIFSPGDYVCRKGDVGKEMYIIKRGKLDVVADDGGNGLRYSWGWGCLWGKVLAIPIYFLFQRMIYGIHCQNIPEAKRNLLEKGKQILMKDNLIDEDRARQEEAEQESINQKLQRLELHIDGMSTRLARLLGEYSSFQLKIKQRLTRLEKDN
ncbi:CNGA3 [Lepeophtheirus salmonis]|uniref:CNGA3 n=1 Tax=Lepeophtheirus salmonis TaxID=72036 RepID=A0A7R8HBD1_LEPSM|nr:CNGA3 [Lepeophtheirus salmonis]CAF2983486.1 CNGA3 [Lepeophtheirus salmonis]